jgi:HJR/Mrr/RecB family endonuclease
VENRPADIWSIVDRVEPGWLGTLKDFSQRYEGDDTQSGEEWVLRQLQVAGYDVGRTPQTRDKGSDGLAIFRAGDGEHTIILQCKHPQSGGNCDRQAIEQVLGSITAYTDIIRGEAVPMVVTNAVGFTKDAMALATQEGVWLIRRDGLRELRRFRLQTTR